MATDRSRLGNAIVSALQSGGYYPSSSPEAAAKSKAEWSVIAGAILDEITTNMDIDLSSGDIKVDPGTFMDSVHGPVTGIGLIEVSTLSGKLR